MEKYIRVTMLLVIFCLIVFSLTLINKKENAILNDAVDGKNEQSEIIAPPENIVGGDRDEHGCIGSAGYSWCGIKNKCLRIWEESCDAIPDKQSVKCGLENCHGLEIKCGSNPTEMCTAIYALGDKCRQHASCGIINGTCSQIENQKFTSCRICVETCMEKYATDSSMRIFECESKCE